MGTSYEELYNEYKNGSLSIFDGDEYYGDMLEAMEGGKHEISLFNRFFEKKIDLMCNTTVEHIHKASDGTYELAIKGGETINCKYLIAAPGRSGAEWFSSECKNMGINLINNQVDIGVRVDAQDII